MELLERLAGKLNIPEGRVKAVVRKADEYSRRLSVGGCSSLGNATSLAVVCLHLAAQKVLNESLFDLKRFQTLSGLRVRSHYISLLDNVESQLGLEATAGGGGGSTELTIEEICVKLGCPNLRIKSLELLANYRAHLEEKFKHQVRELNLNKPLYLCGAVGAAAKLHKGSFSLDKSKLYELSRASSKAALNKVIQDVIEAQPNKEEAVADEEAQSSVAKFRKILEERNGDEDEVQGRKVKRQRLKTDFSNDDGSDDDEYEKWKADILRRAAELRAAN